MAELSSPGIQPGLEKIERLLAEMGNPEEQMHFVHIAGTNGKGSNAFMVSALLRQAGHRVGRFISPHIHSYCERFSIDDVEISGDELLSYLELIADKIRLMLAKNYAKPTEFEILTALALQYFKDKQADITVLEVGMGGLYDSTNIVTPRVSVITGIAYDHTAYLGSSLEEIAVNKAGIIKPKVPVVTADLEDVPMQIIQAQALQKEAALYKSSIVEVIPKSQPGINGRMLDIKLPGLRINDVFFPLLGEYQLQNLATALTAAVALGEDIFPIQEEMIRNALAMLEIPGRMEIIKHRRMVVLDAAHNPQAAQALDTALMRLFPGKQKILLCGVLDDKDAQNILKPLLRDTRVFIITKPDNPRGLKWQRLQIMAETQYPDRIMCLEENISKAVALGLDMAREDEYLLITGSFFVLEQARDYLTNG